MIFTDKIRVFLIHGWGGSPDRDWMPCAKAELERKGYEVIAPAMPDTEHPVIDAWVQHLTSVVGTPEQTDIFIGHSIGCQTILRYLEDLEGKVGKVILVAPWFTLSNLDNVEMWTVADPWLKTPIDFGKIKSKYQSMTTIFSDNDPWVPYQVNVDLFRAKFNPEIITLHNKGHITEDEGSTQLPELLPLFE